MHRQDKPSMPHPLLSRTLLGIAQAGNLKLPSTASCHSMLVFETEGWAGCKARCKEYPCHSSDLSDGDSEQLQPV